MVVIGRASPPYALSFVFGASDLPWLNKLAAIYLGEVEGATYENGLLEERRVHYRQVLRDIATKRVGSHPALAARYDNGTLLRDLKDPAEKVWLDAVISLVQANIVWGDLSVPPRYRELLSARDLPYLSRRSQDLMQVAAVHKEPEERRREWESIWAEFRNYLAHREVAK